MFINEFLRMKKFPKLDKIKTIMSIFYAYLGICGLFIFSLFIMEEAIQQATWATWAAQNAKRWDLVLTGCDLIRNINRGLKITNYSVGWIQPLAFFSYRAYSKATDYYVEALEQKVFAHSPQSFIGRRIRFTFIPEKIIREGGEIKLIHKRIQVIMEKMPVGKKVEINGIVEMRGKVIVVRNEGNQK